MPDQAKAVPHRFLLLSALIVLAFVAIGPRVFSSEWVSSSDFHACIEICSSFIALIAALACLAYYFGQHNRYFLIVGLGFFICGSEDLIHGILGFERLTASSEVDFSRFIPGTYVAGRTMLAVLIIAAALLEPLLRKRKPSKWEVAVISVVALGIGGGTTVLATMLPLPQLIHPEKLISRPVDFVSAILFSVALVITLRRYLDHRDVFTGSLLACIVLNLGGQVYMSFSKQLFDVFFDVAHWANILSYCVPVAGVTLDSLGGVQKAQRESTERRRAEAALEDEQRKFVSMFDGMDQAVYVADPETYEMLYMNGVARGQWGDGVGQPCYRVLQSRAEPCHFCTNDRIFGEHFGQPYIWEFQNEINGNWYRCFDRAIHWSDGRLVRFELAYDISSQKKIEQSVLREKQLSDATLDSLPGVFYMFDVQGRMVRWNRNFERVSGYSAEELSAMHPTEFFTGEDKHNVAERIRDVFAKGEAFIEAEFVAKDGCRTPYLFTDKHVLFEGEDYLVGMGMDISDRKRAAGQLEQRFNELSDAKHRLETLVSGTTEREQRMVDLKQEVNELLQTLGQEPKYQTPQRVAELRAGVGGDSD